LRLSWDERAQLKKEAGRLPLGEHIRRRLFGDGVLKRSTRKPHTPTVDHALLAQLTDTVDLALDAPGCDSAKVMHKPRLLSDNGASYISEELAIWLEGKGMSYVCGAPYHPQTQGKIERWHQILKNRILLENYFLLGDLENQIRQFIEHYNNQRYHESLSNLTPADVYFGRGQSILEKRRNIKLKTLKHRRLQHNKQAA